MTLGHPIEAFPPACHSRAPVHAIRALLCLALALPALAAAAVRTIPPALGPHVNLNASDFAEARSFRANDRIVGTYYFYWYDAPSQAHILDGDGTDALTTHPPTLDGLSWRSAAWHRRQLEDMEAAGIDVVLPVFWGAPSEQSATAPLHWSYEGLPPLVQAREELLRAGKHPPRLGLFYDTSTLQHNTWREHQDLTTARGREWFYATVRDFFSLIPPRHWAMIDDRPIVLLYSAAFARAHDQGVVAHLQAEFPKQFGGRVPWLAREVSWRIQSDSVVAWGGALGLKNPGGVASLGPGYDHSAVPGRAPLVVDRRGGAFYEEQWRKLLRRPAHFVMVETWNEWHEGTDVAESREYGRRYIELTRKYADLFKQGWRPPWPEGPYSGANSLAITLGRDNREAGLRQLEPEDGRTAPATFAGRDARASQPSSGLGRYLYFAVDDSFKEGITNVLTLEVEYFDAAPGRLSVDFDGSDGSAPFGGAYTRAPETVKLDGTKAWRKSTFTLRGARFTNAQNGGGDFRLVLDAPSGAVARLVLRRSAATEQVLFDPSSAVTNITPQDATISELGTDGGRTLRVVTGTRQHWPGITLRAPQSWDLSAHAAVAVTLRNPGSNEVHVNCRVDNPGADGTKHCVTDSLALAPGRSGVLKVALKRTSDGKLGGKLFGMRGYPVAPGGPHTVDPRNITQVVLFVNKPAAVHTFEVQETRAIGSYMPPTASVADAEPFFPFIDTFGQYRHRDWPGKVHSPAELAERRAAEAKELAAQPGPAEWNQYGGWAAGPKLEATGFFRVQKHAGRWWFVDPEGRLFWSHGIDCVRMLDSTPIDERAAWFQDFPGDQPEFREFRGRSFALKGHYAGRSPATFSFAGANLLRKYGPDWRTAYNEVVHRRLRSWGLNTIGNWSDETLRLLRRTPYTDTLNSRGAKQIEGSDGYWGKFPDVFDPSFEAGVRRSMAGRQGRSAGDPWCLGYFSDNEMSWGDDTSLGVAALKSPPGQAAKQVFIADLKTRHGDIARLNAAWGTRHASWNALLESRETPDKGKAREDLVVFYSKAAEQYFRTVRDAIKAVAPHQLYLGCRFAAVNDRAAVAAGRYCDVVSYNLYKRTIADFQYPGPDKPLLVGEFHFGALDRGMFHPGLVPVADQAGRAQAYRDYVLGAARHPQFVGTHWFQWKDEPTTGRVYDEENYQIGFVDIADTPYRETIEASRAVGSALYRQRLGEMQSR